ncbi:hypothetical protein RB195_002342 [Necator americanus]
MIDTDEITIVDDEGEDEIGMVEAAEDFDALANESAVYLIVALNIAVAGFLVKCLLWLIKYINSSSTTIMNWPCNKLSNNTIHSLREGSHQIQMEERHSSANGAVLHENQATAICSSPSAPVKEK